MSLGRWAAAFAFTQMAEIPIYRHGLRSSFLRSFGASAITHPIVWYVVVESGWRAPWLLRTGLGEAFAISVEAAYFGLSFGWKKGLLWSAIANGASFAVGLVGYALFG